MRILLAILLVATLCQCRLDLSNYQVVFNQDFTVIKNLSVSSRGPLGNPPVGSQSWWMSHCNFYTDYNYFLDPQGDLQPFSTANNRLTIRTQSKTINGQSQLTSGLLNSHDDNDLGFSNKWGYFEAKAWLPQGPATWPAFWMLDAGYAARTSQGYGLEIDVVEQYGTPTLYTTLHYWDNTNSGKSAGKGFYSCHCDMMSGWHTYGFDYQPDYLTFYYDRVQTFRVANDFSIMGTGLTGKWDKNMTVLINNGYNTGASQADLAVLASRPADMKVEYVRVWSGQGASNGVNNYPEINTKTWGWDEYTLTPANPFNINGASLQLTAQGNIVVLSKTNSILWQSGTTADCSVATNCRVTFQGDGNWVAYSASGAFWGSSTYNRNAIGLTFQNTAPYLSMVNGSCATVWTATNTVAQSAPANYVVPPVCTATPTSQYNTGRSFVVFPNAGLTVNTTTPFLIDGVTLQVTTGGDVQVIRRVDQTVLWHTGTSGNCATASCSLVFQNDGNLVFYGANGWSSNTYNQFNSVLMFQNTAPYLRIMNSGCSVIWSSS